VNGTTQRTSEIRPCTTLSPSSIGTTEPRCWRPYWTAYPAPCKCKQTYIYTYICTNNNSVLLGFLKSETVYYSVSVQFVYTVITKIQKNLIVNS